MQNAFDEIYTAAKEQKPTVLSTAIQQAGVDVHKNGQTPASLLALQGEHAAVDLLVNEFGAGINYVARGYKQSGNADKIREWELKGAKIPEEKENLYATAHYKPDPSVTVEALKVGILGPQNPELNAAMSGEWRFEETSRSFGITIQGLAYVGNHAVLEEIFKGNFTKFYYRHALPRYIDTFLSSFTKPYQQEIEIAIPAFFKAGYFANQDTALRLLSTYEKEHFRHEIAKQAAATGKLKYDIMDLLPQAKEIQHKLEHYPNMCYSEAKLLARMQASRRSKKSF